METPSSSSLEGSLKGEKHQPQPTMSTSTAATDDVPDSLLSLLFPWIKWLCAKRSYLSSCESAQDSLTVMQLISDLSLVNDYQVMEHPPQDERNTANEGNDHQVNECPLNEPPEKDETSSRDELNNHQRHQCKLNESSPINECNSHQTLQLCHENKIIKEQHQNIGHQEQDNKTNAYECNDQQIHENQSIKPELVKTKNVHVIHEDETKQQPQNAHVVLAQEFIQEMDRIRSEANDAAKTVFRAMHKPDTLRRKILDFIEECRTFQNSGKNVEISLGYHYTSKYSVSAIKTHGLLTHNERKCQGLSVASNGMTYGDGIYTSSNPFAFRDFRIHTGIAVVVLRLTGNIDKGLLDKGQLHLLDPSIDSLKRHRAHNQEMVVLRSSSQCLALCSFKSRYLDESDLARRILVTHGKLSKLIRESLGNYFFSCHPVGKMKSINCKRVQFNTQSSSDQEKETRAILQKSYSSDQERKKSITERSDANGRSTELRTEVSMRPNINRREKQTKQNPEGSCMGNHIVRYASLKYVAPTKGLMTGSLKQCCNKLPHSKYSGLRNLQCSICFEELHGSSSEIVSLKQCKHVFHRSCLEQALQFDPKCPICRLNMAQPQGKMPSGSMMIGLDPELDCQGFPPGLGTWRIQYSIKCGEQKMYHPHPGVRHAGTKREACVPNTTEGRQLLKRLAYAFSRGLTFTVGVSLTSGRENVCTWGSIHHKTKTHAGTHGWPDPSYFLNCNEELDSLGVPCHDNPSLDFIFSSCCTSSVNFGYLFSRDG